MEPEIPLKTSADVSRVRVSARLLGRILSDLSKLVVEGKSVADIAAYCETRLSKAGAEASQRRMGFPAAACVSVNNVAAHGIPGPRHLEAGDLVTVDISTRLQGWAADAAWTYLVGSGSADALRVLRAAWSTTKAGVAACRAGRRLGDVGAVIEHTAARHGCSVVREFTGHGIGEKLHEAPAVPNTGTPHTGTPIVPGMVLTIEPVVSLGTGEVTRLDDGWTYVSRDGALTAQFEQTVAVFSDRTEVLTFDRLLDTDVPPY